MIKQLARCPYCDGCMIAVDDRPELVFNPSGNGAPPCEHLIWLECRYTGWEVGQHGTPRVGLSCEFRWERPELATTDVEEHLAAYWLELVNAGEGWAFAPTTPFRVLRIWVEEKQKGAGGKEIPAAEIDGKAVFAQDWAAFLAALPAAQRRHMQSLEIDLG